MAMAALNTSGELCQSRPSAIEPRPQGAGGAARPEKPDVEQKSRAEQSRSATNWVLGASVHQSSQLCRSLNRLHSVLELPDTDHGTAVYPPRPWSFKPGPESAESPTKVVASHDCRHGLGRAPAGQSRRLDDSHNRSPRSGLLW